MAVCRLRPSPRELAALFKERGSIKAVAEELGVSTASVKRWLVQDGLADLDMPRLMPPHKPRLTHSPMRILERRFVPIPYHGCAACAAYWFCQLAVRFGFVACEWPNPVQVFQWQQHGLTLRQLVAASDGLLEVR